MTGRAIKWDVHAVPLGTWQTLPRRYDRPYLIENTPVTKWRTSIWVRQKAPVLTSWERVLRKG